MRAENRRKEYQREDHMRLVAQDKLLRANVASDQRVENKRYVCMFISTSYVDWCISLL